MPSDPSPPPGRESTALSSRAQAILEEVERLAALGREQLRSPGDPDPGGPAHEMRPGPAPPGWHEPGRGWDPIDTAAAEARLRELVEAVGHRAESMRGTLDDLGRILNGLQRRVDAAQQTQAPARAPATPSAPPAHPTSTPRLVAIEMAVAGSTRLEVARRLRGEFGLERADAILDDVFGPGTGPHSRMPWGG